MKIDLFNFVEIHPLSVFGLTGEFWTLNIDTIIQTWCALLAIVFFIIVGRQNLYKESGRIKALYEELLGFFLQMGREAFIPFNVDFYVFITTIFLFTSFCCFVGIIPFLDESTRDLNTTLALALISFCYVQYQKIKTHGLIAYVQEFLQPVFLLAPVNIIGELAKIASMAFRLFGNILGGSVLLLLAVQFFEDQKFVFLPVAFFVVLFELATKHYPALKEKKILGWIFSALSLLVFFITGLQFYGVFEGLVQAFVLTMLTTTYLGMAAQHDNVHGSSSEVAS